MARLVVCVLALLLSPAVAAQSVPDSSFAEGGFSLLETDGVSSAQAVLPRADGGVLVGGAWGAGEATTAVVAFGPDGALDTAFGVGGVARLPTLWRATITDLVRLDDGRLLLIGVQTASSAYRDLQVVRLSPDGDIDTGFGFDGRFFVRPDGAPGNMVAGGAATDGTSLYLAAQATPNAGPTRSFVARIGEDGLDATFGTGGALLFDGDAELRGLALDREGRAVVVGSTPDTPRRITVQRLTSDGAFDPGFAAPTLATEGALWTYPTGVAVSDSGRILVSGFAGLELSSNAQATGLWALDATGAPDSDFGDGGVATVDVFGANEPTSGIEAPLRPLLLNDGAIALIVDSNSTAGIRLLVVGPSGAPAEANGEGGIARLFQDRFETYTNAAVTPDGSTVVVGGMLLRENPSGQGFQQDLWAARLMVTAGVVSADETSESPSLALAASPNPISGILTLRLAPGGPADVELSLFDALGRRVATLHDGPAPAGELRATWDASGAAPGVYVVRARVGEAVTALTVTVTR